MTMSSVYSEASKAWSMQYSGSTTVASDLITLIVIAIIIGICDIYLFVNDLHDRSWISLACVMMVLMSQKDWNAL